MLDKTLVKKNFKRSILTYNDNACIQKHTADKIIELIKNNEFQNILEIGSYTGILTSKITELNPKFKRYIAVDIVEESAFYLNKINQKIEFINEDIEHFKTDIKFDLIVSNASLQWCSEFGEIFKNLKSCLNNGGVIAVSIFNKGNLPEIKEAFGVELNYPDEKYILDMKASGILSSDSVIKKESISLEFKSPTEVLRHLKNTGVNSLKTYNSIGEIKRGFKILNDRFNNKITYKPLYIKDISR